MKVQITILYLNPSLVSLLPSLSDSYRGCSTFYLPPRCHGVPRNTFVSAKTQIEFYSRMLQHPQVHHHSCFSQRIVNQGASFPLQTSCQSLSIFRIHAVSNFTLFLRSYLEIFFCLHSSHFQLLTFLMIQLQYSPAQLHAPFAV